MFVYRYIFLHLTFNLLLSNLLFAATPPKYGHGGLKAHLSAEYFASQENYDNIAGQFEKLPNNNKFEFYKLSPGFLYGLTNKWGIGAQVDFINGTSVSSTDERTTNQVTDVHGQIFYKIIKNKFYILPQLKLSFPFTSFEQGQDDPILNDGAISIELGLWIEKKWFKHRFYIYGSYKAVMDGRAHLIPFEAGVYNTYKGFIYGLAISGNEIASNDEFLESPQNRFNRTDQLNAGSLKFYSVNPKTLNALGWLGYRVSRNIVAQLKVDSTINGSNSAKGNTYSLNLKWRAIKSSRSRRKNRIKDDFKIEGVDTETLKE